MCKPAIDWDPLYDQWCCECRKAPAKMVLPDTGRRICGVCAHRLAVAQDLALRIEGARLKASSSSVRPLKQVA